MVRAEVTASCNAADREIIIAQLNKYLNTYAAVNCKCFSIRATTEMASI